MKGKKVDRRTFIKLGASLAGASAANRFIGARAQGSGQYEPRFPIEKGARLRLLRWSGFVKSDEEYWNANTRRFTKLTGVPVDIEYITWEDVRPKAALAANLGAGPDIVMGWYDDPHLYPQRLLDVSDLAEYLGNKYGGWYDVARIYGYSDVVGHWIAIPVGAPVAALVYRQSWAQEAGFDTFPTDLDGLLKLSQALKKNGHPTGFALGHAVGDGNVWVHWLLWSFGGKQVEADGKTIAINRQETWNALEYAKELYQTMVSGVASWLDSNNNRAFLSGAISLTGNGISIYYAAKRDFPEIAKDLNHANFPVGPVGRPTEFHLFTEAFIFKYTRYPNAAKEYLRFMLEKDQAAPWVEAMNGYVTPALKAYRDLPVWTRDPKVTPYRDGIARMLYNGYAGPPGPKAAAALSEFVVLDMFADACVRGMSPKAAAKRAEDRLRRIYS